MSMDAERFSWISAIGNWPKITISRLYEIPTTSRISFFGSKNSILWTLFQNSIWDDLLNLFVNKTEMQFIVCLTDASFSVTFAEGK